jgi:hypothetical protein
MGTMRRSPFAVLIVSPARSGVAAIALGSATGAAVTGVGADADVAMLVASTAVTA